MRAKSPELDTFRQLQQRLGPIFDHQAGTGPLTIVVVPSVTLSSDELKKIPGAEHFEQRLLFELQRLRRPQTRMIYMTSQKIDPVIIDYTLDLVPALSSSDARLRLTLLDCNDESPNPLTAKILDRPELVERVVCSITDASLAFLITYTSSPLERELAVRLGIPLFACDPELSYLGTKSGGRNLFREASVPVPDGFEDLWDSDALVHALADLRSMYPHLAKAVVKLNDSFAGGGNATFSYAGAPSSDIAAWIAAELPNRLYFADPGEAWPSYNSKLQTMGGIAECYIDVPGKRSPSVQVEIGAHRDVRVVSTHDQLLGGGLGQTFVGCVFPAVKSYRLRIQELALRTGKALAERGVIGHLSVDFLADDKEPGGPVYALEINLRMGGATAPFFFLDGLVEGRYDYESGNYLTPEQEPRYYVASDRLQRDAFRALRPGEAIDRIHRHRLNYSRESRTGVVLYMLGALPEFGKVGVVAVERSPEAAQRLFDAVAPALEVAGGGEG